MKKKIISSIIILSVIVIYIVINNNVVDKTKIINYNGNDLLVTIDGTIMDSLPSSGNYYLTDYECSNSKTTLTWDRTNYKLDVSNSVSKGGVYCDLTFKSNPLLSEMEVGSYVTYEGVGGTVGSTSVSCSGDFCSGVNANQASDTSGYTYGYCSSSNYRYYTTGWRIAYIKDNKVALVSAGAPECLSRTSSDANDTYIKTANATALKYCNENYVDGSCTCTSTTSGQCDSGSTDAWAINDYDFYYITKAISGVGKRLADDSSTADDSLGETTGGTLTTAFCYGKYSYKECGYNNDLIDNGGYYWFTSRYTKSSTSSYYTYGMNWNPSYRIVSRNSNTTAYGLRPVISLSSSVYVKGGDGTMSSPYTIGTTKTRLLSTASVGSYVEYVGNNGCSGDSCSGGSDGFRIAYTSNGNAYIISGGITENVSTTSAGATTYTDKRASSSSNLTVGEMEYSYYTSYTLNSSTGVYTVSGLSDFYWDKEYDMISDYSTLYTCAGSTTCTTLYEISDYEDEMTAVVYKHTATATTTEGGAVEASTHISNLNNKALTYCNTAYADGGVCNNTTAWSVNGTDYYNIIGSELTLNSTTARTNDILGLNLNYWYATSASDSNTYYWSQGTGSISSSTSESANGLRPIIKLDSSIIITGGTGTVDDPYEITKP